VENKDKGRYTLVVLPVFTARECVSTLNVNAVDRTVTGPQMTVRHFELYNCIKTQQIMHFLATQ